MGRHLKEGSRDMRIKHAHLDKTESGDIIAVYYDFTYHFTGEQQNTLTLKGETIIKHPEFKGIGAFEGWCMRYYAEHDILKVMGSYRLDNKTITSTMRKEARDEVEQRKYSYKEDGIKVGKPKSEFNFETVSVRLPRIENGRKIIDSKSPVDHIEYNLLLIVKFPLLGMSFEATDVHTYRWNSKYNHFEHEDTEIL